MGFSDITWGKKRHSIVVSINDHRSIRTQQLDSTLDSVVDAKKGLFANKTSTH